MSADSSPVDKICVYQGDPNEDDEEYYIGADQQLYAKL